MNICLYGASSAAIDQKYLDISYETGKALAGRGHALYFGGGDSGVMGAAARGAASEGGRIVSVVPSFFNVDGILYPSPSEIVYTETMSERKMFLEKNADAFIAMPGGIGTYDEFFECITNKQLGIHNKPVTVLNAFHYYDLLNELLEHTIAEDFMKKECRIIYEFFTDPEELLDYIEGYVPRRNKDSFFKDVHA